MTYRCTKCGDGFSPDDGTICRIGQNTHEMSQTSRDEADHVNHPPHYNSGKIEVIDFIEDQKLDHHRATAIKYICRAGKKDPKKFAQDLRKAIWYLHRRAFNFETTGEQ